MGARQGELLPKPPRRMRGQLMHVCDAGPGEGPGCVVQMHCQRCGYRTRRIAPARLRYRYRI